MLIWTKFLHNVLLIHKISGHVNEICAIKIAQEIITIMIVIFKEKIKKHILMKKNH